MGFLDFTFPVGHWEKQRDGTMSVHVRGTLNDIEIGLIIDILPQWRQQDVESSPVRMKLVLQPRPKEAYAEFFTSIDLVQAKMEFHEKDPKYRVPIVAALDGR